MITITSSSNPTIKEIKSLHRKKDRWISKLYIVEGIKMVEEIVKNGYEVKYFIYTDKLFDLKGGTQLFKRIESYRQLINVPEKLYGEITKVETPQGIMAVLPFREPSIDDLFKKPNPFIILLDRVQDPGNLGTIIRTADAFGVDGIIISEGSVDVYNPKVVRATMGSIFRVNIFHVKDNLDTLKKLKSRGLRIYSTSLKGKNFIQEVDFKIPSLLIIGNESKGVSEEFLNMADDLIKIPMVGEAESLNAAVASSIIMYEAMRQRIQ